MISGHALLGSLFCLENETNTVKRREEEEYEVEEILDSCLHRGKLQFLIKWVGYNEPSWQPESDVTGNANEAIEDFYKAHPEAPCRLAVPH